MLDAAQREAKLQRNCDALKRKCDVLARNMSCLFRTATEAISVRDREIEVLKNGPNAVASTSKLPTTTTTTTTITTIVASGAPTISVVQSPKAASVPLSLVATTHAKIDEGSDVESIDQDRKRARVTKTVEDDLRGERPIADRGRGEYANVVDADDAAADDDDRYHQRNRGYRGGHDLTRRDDSRDRNDNDRRDHRRDDRDHRRDNRDVIVRRSFVPPTERWAPRWMRDDEQRQRQRHEH